MESEKLSVKPQIESSWLHLLENEFNKPSFLRLKEFLRTEKNSGKTIYPKGGDIFNAFNHTPVQEVKVVILGQDPYHGPGQAHGLSFSVPKGIKQPPSLKNIIKELSSDLGLEAGNDGDLSNWSQQGVLLLNATLTVEARKAGSHQKKGWEEFTDAVIQRISEEKENVVFILWGSFARSKKALIDTVKHLVIESTHPSPFSARNGFFGSKPFSKTNQYLEEKGQRPINWKI